MVIVSPVDDVRTGGLQDRLAVGSVAFTMLAKKVHKHFPGSAACTERSAFRGP